MDAMQSDGRSDPLRHRDPAARTGMVIFPHAFLSLYFQREILNKDPRLWADTSKDRLNVC